MSAATLRSETHILDLASVGDSLLSSAVRYTRGLAVAQQKQTFSESVDVNDSRDPSSPAVVLVLLHGLGFHKETWEPTISHLFALECSSRGRCSSAPTLVEVWAIDCPDHGEAAALNRCPSRVSCLSYGRAVLALLKSGLLAGPQGRKIILAGHSAGAISLVLAAAHVIAELEWHQAIAGMVLIEPWIVAAEIEGDPAMRRLTHELTRGGTSRRDVWSSRAEAHAYLASHPAFRRWDAGVHRVYVDHGLRTLPTPDYPSQETGFTLAFPKRLESEAYGDFSEGRAALQLMPRVSAAIPLHLVFGAQQPAIVKAMQRSICDHAGKSTSVTYLPGIGHAAPQQSPEVVARTIWGIICEPYARERKRPASRGKL
ncbi:hypothetical protein V8D89_005361 [Ganoderma adspersum]